MTKKLYNAETVETIAIDPELTYEIIGGWIEQDNLGKPWPYAIDLVVNGDEFIGRFESVEDARWAAYDHMAFISEL